MVRIRSFQDVFLPGLRTKKTIVVPATQPLSMRSPQQRRLRTWGRNLGSQDNPRYREYTDIQRLILHRVWQAGLRYFDGCRESQERLILWAQETSVKFGPEHCLDRNDMRVSLRVM